MSTCSEIDEFKDSVSTCTYMHMYMYMYKTSANVAFSYKNRTYNWVQYTVAVKKTLQYTCTSNKVNVLHSITHAVRTLLFSIDNVWAA